MQVTALAEALVSSRRADGVISLADLHARLSRAGLEELAHAVASLARRVNSLKPNTPLHDKHPWI